jgi:hypothetical protein
MKINRTTLFLFAIIGILILILFFKGCGTPNGTKPVVITEVKTTYKTHTDTIPFYKDSIIIKHLTVIDSIPSSEDSSIINYTTAVNDSLLDGEIFTQVKRDGTLVDQNFTYLPKFPKYIHTTDSVIIETKETIYKDTWAITGGVNLYGNTSTLGIAPTLGFKTKKDHIFMLGYGVLDKTIHLNIQLKIFGNKKKVQK